MFKDNNELKEFLSEIKKENIIFKKHFYDKKNEDRIYLNETFVIETIINGDLLGFQKQKVKDEERYRIGFKLSNKYKLVVVAVIESKNLYIITSWKTNRKWQKAIQK